MDGEPDSHGTTKIQAMAERLAPLADAAGVPRPDCTAFQGPEIRLEEPIEKVCQRIVEIVAPRQALFVRNQNEVGTVDPESGTWEPMPPARFVTWLSRQNISITEPNPRARSDEQVPPRRCADLPEQKAKLILASDTLTKNLPPLRAVNVTRLPVFRKALDEREDQRRKGFQKIELLPIGYDEETGIYTLPGNESTEEMHPEEGVQLLESLIHYFPWADERNRKAAHVAAMLTCFCDNLFAGRSPMFLYVSQLPGSGKTMLARMALEPVLGLIGACDVDPTDKPELRKVLDVAAREGVPALFFDDLPIGYKLKHSPLLSWLTSDARAGRVLGAGASFKTKVRTVTVATGAQIELDSHNERRTILIDLWPTVTAAERELPPEAVPITSEFFRDEAWMGRIRGALWSLIRHWDECHRPRPESKLWASFEGWSRVVPGIVSAAGFGDALASYAAVGAGGNEGKEVETLARLAVERFALKGDGLVTLPDLAALARQRELLSDVLGHLDSLVVELDRNRNHSWELPHDGHLTDGEKRSQAARYLDKSSETKFGRLLKHHGLIGREIRCDGRVWQFGHRRDSKRTRWTIKEVISENPDPEV